MGENCDICVNPRFEVNFAQPALTPDSRVRIVINVLFSSKGLTVNQHSAKRMGAAPPSILSLCAEACSPWARMLVVKMNDRCIT